MNDNPWSKVVLVILCESSYCCLHLLCHYLLACSTGVKESWSFGKIGKYLPRVVHVITQLSCKFRSKLPPTKMPLTIVFPEEYSYVTDVVYLADFFKVIGAGVLSALVLQYLGERVGSARKVTSRIFG